MRLFAISLNDDPSSVYLVLEWAFGVNDFFDRPGSELLWSIFFVYVGILSGAVFFLSDFLLEIVHLLVGILLNPLIPKKTHAQWEYVFSCICFNLLISVFVAITRLGIRSFTGGSPEKLKYIDPNVEMTL